MNKKEYIERGALLEEMQDRKYANPENYFQRGVNASVDILTTDIKHIPAADVVEVRHGEWEWHTEVHGNPIDGMYGVPGYRCSNCKVLAEEYGVDGDIYEEPPTRLHYCPHCGAKMDGGKHDG